MNDLMKFYYDFLGQRFVGNVKKIDEHTFSYYPDSIIFHSVLKFVALHCPDSLSYYVGRSHVDSSLYLTVYDD